MKLRWTKTIYLKKLVEFYNKSRPRTTEGKDKKIDTYESEYTLYKGRELILNTFKNWIFPIKTTKCAGQDINS